MIQFGKNLLFNLGKHNFGQNFTFKSTCMTLKIRPRSPKSNQLFTLPTMYLFRFGQNPPTGSVECGKEATGHQLGLYQYVPPPPTGDIITLAFVCLLDLILYIPVKFFSVMSGPVYLGWTSTKQGLNCVLLKDTGQCSQWGSNLQPFDLRTSSLPLSHCSHFG